MSIDDIERGDSQVYGDKQYDIGSAENLAEEQEALLARGEPTVKSQDLSTLGSTPPTPSTSVSKLLLAFVAGVGTCFAIQLVFPSLCLASSFHVYPSSDEAITNLGQAGSQVVSCHFFPSEA